MPCYPAVALLLGSAMAAGGAWIRRGTRVLFVVAACAGLICAAILIYVRGIPAPGDISSALSPHPAVYKLSLGHMADLTLESFAYLRPPLLLAAVAFFVGAIGCLCWSGHRAFLSAALMMVLFLHAARIAMVGFDPYLSSRPLAEAIRRAPPGDLIVEGHYYPFSSVFFYLNRGGLLLNGKRMNLEYGANAPGAPHVFIDDAEFARIWNAPARYYLVAGANSEPRLEKLAGHERMNVVARSGGKVALTNQPVGVP